MTNNQRRSVPRFADITAFDMNMASTRDAFDLIMQIRDPANHAALQSNKHRQPLSWLLFCLDMGENDLVTVCKEILKVCPNAASVPNRRGELPLHLSAELGYADVSALLLEHYPQGARHRTADVPNDGNSNVSAPIAGTTTVTLNGVPVRRTSRDVFGRDRHRAGNDRGGDDEEDQDDDHFYYEGEYDSDDVELFFEPEYLAPSTPVGELPIHSLARGQGEDDDDDDGGERSSRHARLLHAAYPEGSASQNDEGQTPLHVSASHGRRASTFLELLRLCPEAASKEDVEGDRPIDSLLHHPYGMPYERFGERLPEMVTELVRADNDTVHRIERRLNDGQFHVLGLCPNVDDQTLGLSGGVCNLLLDVTDVMSAQETLATCVHLVYESRTVGTVSKTRRYEDYRPHHQHLLHRMLAADLPEEIVSWFLLMHRRLRRRYYTNPVTMMEEGKTDPAIRRIARHLIDFNVDAQLSVKDENGDFPVHVAARRRWPANTGGDDLDLLRYVVRASPPEFMSQKDADGRLPLHSAVMCNGATNHHVARMIFQAFPSAHTVVDERSGLLPVHAAMLYADPAVTHMLLRASPDVLLRALPDTSDGSDGSGGDSGSSGDCSRSGEERKEEEEASGSSSNKRRRLSDRV